MNRCWNGMSASSGVDPNLRAFSRYSGVFHGWRRVTRAQGVRRPSTSNVTSSNETTCLSRANAPRKACGGATTKKYGLKPEYSTAMPFPSRVREDVPVLVSPVMLVLDRKHDD